MTIINYPTPTLLERVARATWGTPIYQADCGDAAAYLPHLKEMILEAEKTDDQAANFGGIDAIKSCQNILLWDDPAVEWIKARIIDAAVALTTAELGDAAVEVTQGVLAEGWAVVYREGGSLRPHRHHDSAWSGVLYVEVPSAGPDDGDAGYLQLQDPRAAAIARGASQGTVRIRPAAGRMVAFPGWVTHSVQATVSGGGLRICVAWNVAYDKNWTGMS